MVQLLIRGEMVEDGSGKPVDGIYSSKKCINPILVGEMGMC
jgi:hypothetical protein